MQQKTISIELREKVGKGVARKLRTQGRVPGVVYGKGVEPLAVSVDAKELAGAIVGEGGRNNLISLQGGGSLNGTTVIVADLQRAALKGEYISVDLHQINLDEKVRVHVPIAVVGTAAGVKDGGMLEVLMHSLDLECLPAQIPGQVEVDVTELSLGHTIHVGDLALPAGVKALDDPKTSVVSIHGKAKEPVAAEEE
ncbi:50S ribosomal protein L25 [Geobacter sp.]|uniref:50S ribosomal protein L25 n=1 Tax=Geobacter sp. TaxID=46610 RepID=UPI001AC217FC|nr:50S ribosomal protein L25 [Geobacter sp.]CAG0974882.1 50S ribosomal protein L25 [Geobacteraceae bacterium]